MDGRLAHSARRDLERSVLAVWLSRFEASALGRLDASRSLCRDQRAAHVLRDDWPASHPYTHEETMTPRACVTRRRRWSVIAGSFALFVSIGAVPLACANPEPARDTTAPAMAPAPSAASDAGMKMDTTKRVADTSGTVSSPQGRGQGSAGGSGNPSG